MKVTYKDATIETTGSDDAFPGTFRVVLSTPDQDRDGDTLLPDEWKMPLPDRITFDSDHGMSVATTVGSGVPSIDKDGRLIVDGEFSSLPRAQETRTLVNEKHITKTSVAFMTVPSTEKGAPKGAKLRELLNGAFVAVPSNDHAEVLDSKSIFRKAGARNSQSDSQLIQSIHDASIALGASPDVASDDAEGDSAKQFKKQFAKKSIAGSLEATQDRVTDALQDAYPGAWVWLRGTLPDDNGGGTAVYAVEDPDTYDIDLYKQAYLDDGSVVTLQGGRSPVDLMETITSDPDAIAGNEPDGATKTPAAGVVKTPAAGVTAAPLSEEQIEIQRRAARIRAYRNIASATTTPKEQ
jgi:hypothetical protein